MYGAQMRMSRALRRLWAAYTEVDRAVIRIRRTIAKIEAAAGEDFAGAPR
jgi:hypothetical protein